MEESYNTVSDLSNALTNGLNNVEELAQDNIDSLLSTAQIICGIAAMLYVGLRLWRSWAKGEAIDVYAMLRPFAIGLVIFFFSGVVSILDVSVSPIESVTKSISAPSLAKAEEQCAEFMELQSELRNKRAAVKGVKTESAEKLGVWKTISKNLTDLKDLIFSSSEGLNERAYLLFVELSVFIVDILAIATIFFYKVYVVLAKVILVLVGPISFALAVFPGFSGNIRHWVVNYLRICLYIPICNIIGLVQSIIICECLYTPGINSMRSIISGDLNGTAEIDSLTIMLQVCSIIMGVLTIMLYRKVPALSKKLLSATGVILEKIK